MSCFVKCLSETFEWKKKNVSSSVAPCLKHNRSRLWPQMSEANPLKMWFLRSTWTEHISPALVTNPNHKETGLCHFKQLIGFRSSLTELLIISSPISIYLLLYSPFLLLYPKKTSDLLINSIYIISQGQMQVICLMAGIFLESGCWCFVVDLNVLFWCKVWRKCWIDVCVLICSALHAVDRF